MNDVPETWIRPGSVSAGFLPDVGVHCRGDRVFLEASRSVWIGASLMCGMAAVALIPVPALEGFVPYYAQVLIALGLVWGAICAVVGAPWILRRFGVTLTVDRASHTAEIRKQDVTMLIPLDHVVGLQFLCGPKNQGGYQLNLVYRNASGDLTRQMLTCNVTRSYVMRIAKAFQRLLDWPVLQPTGN